jgi:hypothetical protein
VSLFDYDPEPAEVKMVSDLRGIYRSLAEEVEERIALSKTSDVTAPTSPAPSASDLANEKPEGVAHA